ncbi:MAG: gliding motility-associated C-terminal domain-containing protein [Phaeodactylibacter sp.]|nr:gliding motility-associated C-terminal domain-containing protein [Phaeodactylibacter sp.]
MLLFLLPVYKAQAQDFTIIAENQNLYSVDIGTCEVTLLASVNALGVTLADITYTPDGQLWGIATDGRLYRINTNTGAVVLMVVIPMGNFSFYTSLVADQNGLIYTVGSNGNTYTYDPVTGETTFLGQCNYGSAGDLTFVDGQLVMAGISNQMIAIDLENPGNSSALLNFNVGGSIFGVVTFVEDCENTVTYASSDSSLGTIFSIDFESGALTPVCNANQIIYGAASELEFLAAAPLVAELVETEPTSCAAPVGTISITVSGGNGGLMYSLDGQNFQSSNVFNNLLPGAYTITVEDGFGCMLEVEVEVESLGDAPAVQEVMIQGTSCGAENGIVTILAENGMPPYEFSINGSDFQVSNLFEGVPAGMYTAIVRDMQGCTDGVEVTIDSSSGPAIEDISIDPCEASGVILNVSVAGGAMPYTYSIDGLSFQTDSAFTAVPSGLITVIAVDAAGCEISEMIEVPEVSPLPELSLNISPVSCANNGGSISVIPEPMTDLSYSINGEPFSGSPIFEGLSAGAYSITVRNDAGCTAVLDAVVLDLEDAPQVGALIIENTTCGENNGRLQVNMENGTPPFTYQLEMGVPQADAVFDNLPSGTYTLLIEDTQGCSIETAAVVAGSTPLSIEVQVSPCGVGASGLMVEISGGSSTGQEFRINQGQWQAEPEFGNLNPGAFTVEARDETGCMDVADVIIEEVPALLLQLDFVRGCGPGESALQVTGNGGNDGLSYQLNSGPSQASGLFTGLSAGNYQLSVSDSLGCISEVLEVAVPGATPLNLNIQEIISARCAAPNGELLLSASGGTSPYFFAVEGVEQSTPRFDNLSSGVLSVLVIDAEGCSRGDSVLLVSDCPIYAPSAFSPNGDGRNDRFELFSGLPFFVVKYQIFDRWGGLLFESGGFNSDSFEQYWDGTAAGEPLNTGYFTYFIEVLDANDQPIALEGGVMLVR